MQHHELRLTQGILKVPVIAVFTKFDQFKFNIKMKLEDENRDPAMFDCEVEKIFREQYLSPLGTPPPPYISLESEDFII
jgi:hypothetical protein